MGVLWALLLTAAALIGFLLYHLNSGPILPCPDGHCPDPDTPEYLAGVAARNKDAPIVALAASISVVLIGIATHTILARIRRRPT